MLSPTNTGEEIDEKRQLYLDAGAQEVWTCDAEGRVQFYDADGRLKTFRLAPGFPARVEI